MAMRRRYAILAVAVSFSVTVYFAPYVLACGPFTPVAIFVSRVHPDFPLESFAAGSLGILQNEYSNSYLVVAYRYLNGIPLNAREQSLMVNTWRQYLGLGPPSPFEPWQVWLDARSKVEGLPSPPKIGIYRFMSGSAEQFLNCPEDAFRTAANTLNARISKFGLASTEVKDWILGQDRVFANCTANYEPPATIDTGVDPLIVSDRQYQIASTYFYQAKWDLAEQMFDAISRNAASPWKDIAPYLVARTLVRKGTLLPAPGQLDSAALANAESDLKRILGNPAQSSSKAAAARLLHFVEFRLHPRERLRELARSVLAGNSGDDFQQDVIDYTLLLSRASDTAHEDDISDWIVTFHNASPPALTHSIEKYQQTHSTAWLIACLSMVNAGNPQAAELVDSAKKINSDSPAYLMGAFYTARLLASSRRKDESRRIIDKVLITHSSRLPPSARNLFFDLRARLSTSLGEFLGFAQRTPSEIALESDERELPFDIAQDPYLQESTKKLMFDEQSAEMLNQRMPLSALVDSANNRGLSMNLRKQIAIAAWTRAVVLGDYQTASELNSLLFALCPELRSELKTYDTVKDEPGKKRFAIFLLLQMPGMRPYVNAGLPRRMATNVIDSYRDNWWCKLAANQFVSDHDSHATPEVASLRSQQAHSMEFLTAAEQNSATKEWQKLALLPAAPNYLTSQVLTWFSEQPDDPRLPQALHLAIQTTRWGCVDQETSKVSKRAFDTLHRQYPSSIWAKRTKYWF